MRYLRPYKLFEDTNNIDYIDSICEEYDITNYKINIDGTIDVNTSVNLPDKKLSRLPLNFGEVSGYFNCSSNNLTSLEGSPKKVYGFFDCSSNNLISLEGSPKIVYGSFYCSNNKLTSLSGCPNKIDGSFDCSDNILTSLEGVKSFGNHFYCATNDIRTFDGFPRFEDLSFDDNPIYNIWSLFRDENQIELLNDYDCIRGKSIIIDRFNEFLREIGKDPVKNVEGYNNI